MADYIQVSVNLSDVASEVKGMDGLNELMNELAETYAGKKSDILSMSDEELTPEAKLFIEQIYKESKEL